MQRTIFWQLEIYPPHLHFNKRAFSSLTASGRLMLADEMSLLCEMGGSVERGMVVAACESVVGLTLWTCVWVELTGSGRLPPLLIVCESVAGLADSLWPRRTASVGFRRRSSSYEWTSDTRMVDKRCSKVVFTLTRVLVRVQVSQQRLTRVALHCKQCYITCVP